MLLRYTTLLTLVSALLQPPGVLFVLAALGWLAEIVGWRYLGRVLMLLALGTLYFFTIVGLISRLLSDLSYLLVDPRISFESVE